MRVQFADFCLDTDRLELTRAAKPLHLTPKALQLLAFLVEHRPKIVKKDDIYRHLWPNTFVVPANLSVLISDVRSALDEDAKHPHLLKTVHGYGYGFVGDVRTESANVSHKFRLHSGSRDFELMEGENIVGRHSSAQVCLEVAGISRCHARITVAATQATIEDLGSKNGTFVNGARVGGPKELQDGDEIRMSRQLLVFVAGSPTRSTITEIG